MQELNPALIEASLQRLQVLLFGRLCTFAGFILSGRFYRADSIERAQRKGGALNVTVRLQPTQPTGFGGCRQRTLLPYVV